MPVPEDGSYKFDGGVGGGTLSYNWRFSNRLFGLEGYLAGVEIHGSSSTRGGVNECGTRLQSVDTVRSRFGPVFDGTLLYATVAQAFGEVYAFIPARQGRTRPSGVSAGRSAAASSNDSPRTGPPSLNIST